MHLLLPMVDRWMTDGSFAILFIGLRLRPRQDGRYFADDVLKCFFLNENVWISLKIPLKLVPKGPINNILALVQIMAWRRPGDKPLSEPMLVFVLTHVYASLGLNELIIWFIWLLTGRSVDWLFDISLDRPSDSCFPIFTTSHSLVYRLIDSWVDRLITGLIICFPLVYGMAKWF